MKESLRAATKTRAQPKKKRKKETYRSHTVLILDVSSRITSGLLDRSTLLQCGRELYENVTTKGEGHWGLFQSLAIRDTVRHLLEHPGMSGSRPWLPWNCDQHLWLCQLNFLLASFEDFTSTADFPLFYRAFQQGWWPPCSETGSFLLTLCVWPPPCREPQSRRPGFIHGCVYSGNPLTPQDCS